jgi:hypothetical protein
MPIPASPLKAGGGLNPQSRISIATKGRCRRAGAGNHPKFGVEPNVGGQQQNLTRTQTAAYPAEVNTYIILCCANEMYLMAIKTTRVTRKISQWA